MCVCPYFRYTMEVETEGDNVQGQAMMPAATDSSPNAPSKASSLREQVLLRAANSDGHFKHQQRGEPDLTLEDKLVIVTDLLDNKPSVFLTRFGKYLSEADLSHFDALKGDYAIDFHLGEIRQRLNESREQTKVKNRRYEAMKQLVDGGEYFSEEEMKQRDPLLYEQMVGQYLNDDEIHAQIDKSDLSFSNILLKHIQVLQNNEVYAAQVNLQVGVGFRESQQTAAGLNHISIL